MKGKLDHFIIRRRESGWDITHGKKIIATMKNIVEAIDLANGLVENDTSFRGRTAQVIIVDNRPTTKAAIG